MAQTEKKNPLGATGETVRENVRLHRERLNLKFADLSRRLEAAGRPIPVLGLSRIEKGERRVDSDDLVALALALEVSPITLLMPNPQGATSETALTATGLDDSVTAKQLWDWLRADAPVDLVDRVDEQTPAERAAERRSLLSFFAKALPLWRAEQIAEGLLDIAALDFGTEEEREAIVKKYSRGRGDGDD
ncbi:helix-turn-helix domain-containing protein [Nocardia asteroides]|nr:helix-turn-helix domain-containing protein [Nocardia asteroides]